MCVMSSRKGEREDGMASAKRRVTLVGKIEERA